MFGKPRASKEYANVIAKLENGKRRVPQHVRPGSLSDAGFPSFITNGVQATFEGFEFFGALMNRQVTDPWTVEETGEPLIADYLSDGPELGRKYRVYFNGFPVGQLQVGGGLHEDGGFSASIDWHRENRAARVLVRLDYLRFIPFDDALSFVSTVQLLVGRFQDRDTAYLLAKLNASAALTGYLWEVQRADDEYVPSFNHRVEGPYDLLRQTTDHWVAQGIDPFERWAGDRPL